MKENVLKRLREELKISQEELANKAGVQRATISMIERGVNRPSVQLAKKLGLILSCEWTVFFD